MPSFPQRHLATYSANLSTNFIPINSQIFVASETTNILNKAPSSPTNVVTYKNKKYGLPKFRFLKREGISSNESDAIWFSEESSILKLNLILQAYREELDVYPLDFRKVTVNLTFEHAGIEREISLKVSQSPFVDEVNVLKNIHASVEVLPEFKDSIYKAFTSGNASLQIDADVWWQKPLGNQNGNAPRPDSRSTFDYAKLKLRGAKILLPNGRLFIQFKSAAGAKKAFETLKYYKMTERNLIKGEGKYNLEYFLSDGKAPVGAFSGEDRIRFDPNKIALKKVGNAWKIVENGNHWMYHFGANEKGAKKAYEAIKYYGFDTMCFIERPNPPMAYLTKFSEPPTDDKLTTSEKFDYKKLKLRGTKILLPNGKTLIKFKDAKGAKKGFDTIKHYKLTERHIIKGEGRYNMEYFLSNGKAPAGSFKDEDVINFDPNKIKVVNKNNGWYIIHNNNHSMFYFGKNKEAAQEAYKIIKKYKFAYSCFVDRPQPSMAYLKAPLTLRLPSTVIYSPPRVINIQQPPIVSGTFIPTGNLVTGRGIDNNQPQKIDVTATIPLKYDKDDFAVFSNIFSDLEAVDQEFKWETYDEIGGGQNFIYYRPTKDPNTFLCLPSAFRLKVNEYSGNPKMQLVMYNENENDRIQDYRINIELELVPYYDPKAMKALRKYLYANSAGRVKYPQLRLDGYKSAKFKIAENFKDINSRLSGQVTEEANFNPSVGFSMTINTNYESFENFRKSLENGLNIGDVTFELEQETSAGTTIETSEKIPVVLDFNKLADIPLQFSLSDDDHEETDQKESNSDEGASKSPKGFHIQHNLPYPVTLGGVELTLLSSAEDGYIYAADYELSTEKALDWPATLPQSSAKEFLLDQDDINELNNSAQIWSDLKIDPYDIRYDVTPEAIMGKVIDAATGDDYAWQLKVECLNYVYWDRFNEAEQRELPLHITIEIREMDDTPLGSIRLFPPTETEEGQVSGEIKMTRSLAQLIRTAKGTNQDFKYRQQDAYLRELRESGWIEKSGEYLSIYPLKAEE